MRRRGHPPPESRLPVVGDDLKMLDHREGVVLMMETVEEQQYDAVVELLSGCISAEHAWVLIEEALRRRKAGRKAPMVHAAEDSAYRKVPLDVMRRSAEQRDALPPQPGSAAFARASGHVDFAPGPHHSRRSAATWPKEQLRQVKRVALDGPEFLPALKKNRAAAASWLAAQLPGNYGMSRTRGRQESAATIAVGWTIGTMDE